MAWRHQHQSKYKNSAPKTPKKEEWMADIPVGALMQTNGNHIKASCHYVAFSASQSGGSSLGILPLDSQGRQVDNLKLINAHTELVTDFDFCPFNDCLLASCSQDHTLRLWALPEGGLTENISTPTVSLPTQGRRLESVLWHPTAEGLLSVCMDNVVKLFDVGSAQEVICSQNHGDTIQGLSWRGNGSSLVTCCKDSVLRVWDPRSNSVIEGAGFPGVRGSRVAWVGDKDMVISTGFNSSRDRCLGVWDVRNMGEPLNTSELDKSTGILIPFYDADTNMLLLASKGGSLMHFYDVTEKEPYLTLCSADRCDQVTGMASVPKRALNVMKGEVMRMLLLTKNTIIPIPYVVPRKTYSEFHADIFPDTASMEPSASAAQWLQGANNPMKKVTLNPSKSSPIPVNRGSLFKSDEIVYVKRPGSATQAPPPQAPVIETQEEPSGPAGGDMVNGTSHGQPPINTPQPVNRPINTPQPVNRPISTPQPASQPMEPPVKAFSQPKELVAERKSDPPKAPSTPKKMHLGARKSKFRYMKGTPLHKDYHFTNLRKVGKTVPGECDMFHANPKFCALPLDGPGGCIAIVKLSQPGKLPEFGIPAVQNGVKVMDFAWDPFNNNRLVVGCEDAKIRVWDWPDEDPEETLTEPQFVLTGHRERVFAIRFHPLARNVLATSSMNHMYIWDLDSMSMSIELHGHTENIFCFGWSLDGKRIATVCKDGRIRMFEPRTSPMPIMEGAGPQGHRGARCVFVMDDQFIVVTGFSRCAERELYIYTTSDLSDPLQTITIDTSPAILIPFYEEDSSVVLLTGRGDSTVFAYEVSPEAPHLFDLSHYRGEGCHQALAYLPKNLCDVTKVEFARAYRLKLNMIEPVSFTVPRVKLDLFQDDIFPDTKMKWEAALSSSEWLRGVNRPLRTLCLQPQGMKSLSGNLEKPKAAPKYDSYDPDTYKTDEQRKNELISAIDAKLEKNTGPLPQDLMEGVDSSEWDD